MRTLPMGFILILLVIYQSMGKESLALYVNAHALGIVIGGTLAILIMSSPWDALRKLALSILDLFKAPQRLEHLGGDIQELIRNRSLSQKSKNGLINYASELWTNGVDPELFIVLISQRREELERGNIDAVLTLRNLAKYPPALGMTGTVMGLVSLFSVLGSNQAALGPALALAMTATFLGLIMSNCIVTPLADHLHVKHVQNEKLYTAIFQILILINRGEPPSLIKDEVNYRAA